METSGIHHGGQESVGKKGWSAQTVHNVKQAALFCILSPDLRPMDCGRLRAGRFNTDAGSLKHANFDLKTNTSLGSLAISPTLLYTSEFQA